VRIWVVDEDVSEVTLAELKPGDFFGELAVLESRRAIKQRHGYRGYAPAPPQQRRLSAVPYEHPDASIDVICEIASVCARRTCWFQSGGAQHQCRDGPESDDRQG